MSICDKLDAVRDYAMGELPAAGIERHLESCHSCAEEFDQLRLTTAALRILPDREIPQRIAFVSDKVFKPSFFAGFWKPAMISASMLAAGFMASHREVAPVVQPQQVRIVETQNVEQAVAKAVAQIRKEDEQRMEKEHQAVMEAINILQDRQNTATLLAQGGQ